jgi:signal peptidase I|tara:strand:- start:518 stop:2224 length:1707 start_codon:yes stop_codon:yes gene_type:complete
MDFTEWLIFILSLQLIHFTGTWRLYSKAGKKSWESAVPIYNAFVLMDIIKRPKWWVFLLFIPVVNIMMLGVIWIETIRSYGKNSTLQSILVIITLGFYIMFINYSKNVNYINKRNLDHHSAFGEWMSSMIFAIMAATLVHTYFIQPFIIPTGSLEKSLLIGDFLFVSKFHYGARVPTTPFATPMVHDTIPILKTRSYLNKPQLPFLRLPGFQKIKRNDIVVFNWPADTVRQFFVREKGVRKPIDKKSNYVKRCVGISGDTLEIKNGVIYINNIQNILPEWAKIQHTYTVYDNNGISSRKLLKYGINDFEREYRIKNITQSSFDALLPYIIGRKGTVEEFSVFTTAKGLPIELVRSLGLKVSELMTKKKVINSTYKNVLELQSFEKFDSINRNISKNKTPNESFFPNRITFDWNEDNFGPIIIPKKGAKILLDKKNYPLYKKIIEEYESNEMTRKDNKFFIQGKELSTYTFKQNYYWMMGDNRHRSEDSRFWGFVPEDHVMGKPVFIWMSIDGFNDGWKNWKIRWNRVFSVVNGQGDRTSYLPHFLILIGVWQIFAFIKKKYRSKKNKI